MVVFNAAVMEGVSRDLSGRFKAGLCSGLKVKPFELSHKAPTLASALISAWVLSEVSWHFSGKAFLKLSSTIPGQLLLFLSLLCGVFSHNLEVLVLAHHHQVTGPALSLDAGVLSRLFITSVPLFNYLVSGLVFDTGWREIGPVNPRVARFHPGNYHSRLNLVLLVKGISRFPLGPRVCVALLFLLLLSPFVNSPVLPLRWLDFDNEWNAEEVNPNACHQAHLRICLPPPVICLLIDTPALEVEEGGFVLPDATMGLHPRLALQFSLLTVPCIGLG